MRRRLFTFAAANTLALTGLAFPSFAAEEKKLPYSRRPEVKKFIADVSKRRNLNPAWVAEVIDCAVYQPKIERLMTPKKAKPGAKPIVKDWNRYKSAFLGHYRIGLGYEFWKDHKDLLLRAQKEYGVDPAAIIGIIGVETRYGQNKGSWKVLDALVTLSFDYTRRAEFFRKELEEFLCFLQQNSLSHHEVVGSFAGAVGMPQFMPSSIRRFGVDFDGDGKIDISRSPADAIGSVANYLAKHGWKAGVPMIVEAKVPLKAAERFGGGTRARHTLSEVTKAGVKIQDPALKLPADTPVFIADLPYLLEDKTPSTDHHILATCNFATVLRYNSSYFYAAAVAELGSAVARRLGEEPLIR